MPQNIFIQVGQCGNQLGMRFWEAALREHAKYNSDNCFNDAMATFFRNVDENGSNIRSGAGNQIKGLRARGILVDMEESVISGINKGRFSELFDDSQCITSVSGCGNNWAVGYCENGPKYHDQLLESIRKQAEHCDALQSFIVCNSMGGGTGSGVGSYLMKVLSDEYPEIHKFATTVFPGDNDDVITCPYNSVLAMSRLNEHADCVLPVENQALFDIVNRISKIEKTQKIASTVIGEKKLAFNAANDIVANMLLNLTSSMRFEGSMNVDINEIVMNLVPFPKLKYLISSMAPLYQYSDLKLESRSIEQMFHDAFNTETQLMSFSPLNSTYLAAGILVRGSCDVSDLRSHISKIKKNLRFVSWNEDGWKTGICTFPPLKQKHSVLVLANNTCITSSFSKLSVKFNKLLKKKAHLHHYTDLMDMDEINDAGQNLDQLIKLYDSHY